MITTQRGIVFITGDKALDATLKQLERHACKRATVSGVRAGLTVLAKAIRREINATACKTPHAASLKAGMRKAVKSRFARKKPGSAYEAKAGFAVGMKGAKRSERLSRGETATSDKHIGVSGKTAHWFAHTGTESAPMAPQSKGVIPRAYDASAGPAMARIKQKTRERIRVEAQKARRKGGKK